MSLIIYRRVLSIGSNSSIHSLSLSHSPMRKFDPVALALNIIYVGLLGLLAVVGIPHSSIEFCLLLFGHFSPLLACSLCFLLVNRLPLLLGQRRLLFTLPLLEYHLVLWGPAGLILPVLRSTGFKLIFSWYWKPKGASFSLSTSSSTPLICERRLLQLFNLFSSSSIPTPGIQNSRQDQGRGYLLATQ